MSLPTRGAWIEIGYTIGYRIKVDGSLPTRGAWIEMQPMRRKTDEEILVAPHTGSVD